MAADLDPHQSHGTTGTRAQRAWRPPLPVAGPKPWWATLQPPAPAVDVPPAVDHAHTAVLPPEGFQHLVDPFPTCKRSVWVAQALQWVSTHSWDSRWLEVDSPAFSLFQVLAGVVEHTGTDVTYLAGHGITAHFDGQMGDTGLEWQVEFECATSQPALQTNKPPDIPPNDICQQ